ncbi:energy-coupling factor transporter transmembrane protein EcfT [Aerococcaceae bacterium DSM 111020]|nr:energy-coupling factor transporter transmembrane protein EcfT [Aerococcaceae bacterium DSM 111020]
MTFRLDPRSKLWALVVIIIISASNVPIVYQVVTFLMIICALFLFQEYQTATRLLIFYIVQWFILIFILPKLNQPFIYFILSFFANGIRSLMPAIAYLNFLFKTTSMAEWTALMHQWHVPTFISIPLMVMVRFFPTIKHDYQQIIRALRMRGIATSPWQWLKHPMKMFEYVLIPLLMNATHVGEDLTIAALTKGFDLKRNKTSIISLSFTIYDGLFVIAISLPLLMLMMKEFI